MKLKDELRWTQGLCWRTLHKGFSIHFLADRRLVERVKKEDMCMNLVGQELVQRKWEDKESVPSIRNSDRAFGDKLLLIEYQPSSDMACVISKLLMCRRRQRTIFLIKLHLYRIFSSPSYVGN